MLSKGELRRAAALAGLAVGSLVLCLGVFGGGKLTLSTSAANSYLNRSEALAAAATAR